MLFRLGYMRSDNMTVVQYSNLQGGTFSFYLMQVGIGNCNHTLGVDYDRSHCRKSELDCRWFLQAKLENSADRMVSASMELFLTVSVNTIWEDSGVCVSHTELSLENSVSSLRWPQRPVLLYSLVNYHLTIPLWDTLLRMPGTNIVHQTQSFWNLLSWQFRDRLQCQKLANSWTVQ